MTTEEIRMMEPPYTREQVEMVGRQCERWEIERERKHRKYTASAATDARAFHYEAPPQTHGEDDEELDCGWDLTDAGEGAESVRTFDERHGGSYYTRAVDRARKRLERNCAELLEVFYLIVRNGKHRGESIAELAALHKLDGKAASDLYFGHRKKILNFFKVQ